MLEFKCFTEWNQLPKNSDALFAQAEKDSLFFSRIWFENLVSTALSDTHTFLLVCVVDVSDSDISDQVLAILPLIRPKNPNHDKQWTSLHHLYSSLYTLLLVDNNQQQILSCLAKGLSQLPFDSLILEPIADDDKNINNLRQLMGSHGLSCMRYARFFNWYHLLQGQSFLAYMQARPSRVRNTIARKQRKLKREYGYEVRLYKGNDVQQAMLDYNAVFDASWKTPERFKDVMDGFTNSFTKLAWTRLAILYIEGKPVAAQLWFVAHKKASIFRLAYDEAWKKYSTGSIITQYMMEYVIDTDKVEEIDYLTGNDRYKQEWMSEKRQRWRLVFTRNKMEREESMNFLHRLMRSWIKNS